MRRRTVQRELFLGMLAVTLGSLTLSLLAVELALRSIAKQRMENDLRAGRVAYGRFWEQRRDLLDRTASLIAEQPHLRTMMMIPELDHETVFQAARALEEPSGDDLILVLDARGKLLADGSDAASSGDSLRALPGVEQAMLGEKQLTLWEYRAQVYHVSVVPIVESDQVAGVLVLGDRIDSTTASAIAEVAQSDVLILHRGQVLGTAWPDLGSRTVRPDELPRLLALPRQAAQDDDVPCSSVEVAGRNLLAVALPVYGERDTLVLSKDLALFMEPYRRAEGILLGIGLVTALLVLFVSRSTSRHLAQPIQELTRASHQLSGGDFTASVPESATEELNTLATSFNGMARRIGDLVQDVERSTRSAADAEANVRIKSQFLANMSHELRTPLNGVVGMTELMLAGDLADAQRESAETIAKSARSLLALVNDILDFARLEAGKLRIEPVRFDPRTEIEDAIELLVPEARGKGLELSCLVAEDVPAEVVSDPVRLRQILTNLLGNALKFTERGEVGLRASVCERGADFVQLRIEVLDSGIGIAREAAAKLFEPFTQADNSNTRKYGGTGLGLAICKQLCSALGGSIGVESQPGKGSLFWFTLKAACEQPALLPARKPIPALANLALLCAERSAANRAILAAHLKPCSRRLDCAENVAGALAHLSSAALCGDPYGLVILDAELPGGGAGEICRVLSESAELSGTKVLLLGPTAQQARPGLAVLRKPLRQAQLFEALARLLEPATAVESASPARAAESRPVTEFVAQDVLLVEDNPVNQRVASRMLQKLGFRVESAGDGQQAVEAVARSGHKLIFMDCQMPVLDGYGATLAIRARESQDGSRAWIIALTANAMEGDRERCLAAGMDDYLTKPLTFEALHAALGRCASARSSA